MQRTKAWVQKLKLRVRLLQIASARQEAAITAKRSFAVHLRRSPLASTFVTD